MNITQLTRKAAFAPIFIACLNLLALSLWYLQARTITARAKTVVIRHFLPRDSGDEMFSASAALKQNANKKEVHFYLDGTSESEKELRVIQLYAISLKTRPEKDQMIKVTLSEDAYYKDVISLINIAMRTDLKRYMLWKNDFYFFPPGTEG